MPGISGGSHSGLVQAVANRPTVNNRPWVRIPHPPPFRGAAYATDKAAARAGAITPSQMHRLAAADLLCRAVKFATDEPTVIVDEGALNLDQGDLERVVERAATMADCDRDPVQGILVGASCRPGLAERAAVAGVELFIYPE